MEQWGSATTRKGGSSDPNVVTLADGMTKVRPLEVSGSPVAVWKQHIIENPRDADQVAFVVCPGRGCPLCRKPTSPKGKQYFPMQTRHAANVWCYEDKQEGVKVLIAGKQIFKHFDDAAEVGIMPHSCDWTIIRKGTGIRTEYTVQRHDSSTPEFTVQPDELLDLSKYEKPTSVQQIFDTLEKMGIDYDQLPVPSFTLEQAMEFVLPYGKLKGSTLESALAQDDGYIDWMYEAKLDGGQFGDALFLAIHTIKQAAGTAAELPGLDATPSVAYDASEEDEPEPAPEPEPEPEPTLVTLRGGGQEITVPESAVQALVASGYERVETTPDPKTEAREVADDEPVAVSLAGGPLVDMPFLAAVATMNSGTAVAFSDPAVDAAAQERLPFNQRQGPPPRTSAVGEAMDAEAAVEKLHQDAAAEDAGGPPVEWPKDPDKPFQCPACGKNYKTQGGLTQHKNKEHADAEAAAAPAQENGSPPSDLEQTRERVKDLLAKQSTSDFTKILDLFERVAGKRNVQDFTLDELLKLEKELQAA